MNVETDSVNSAEQVTADLLEMDDERLQLQAFAQLAATVAIGKVIELIATKPPHEMLACAMETLRSYERVDAIVLREAERREVPILDDPPRMVLESERLEALGILRPVQPTLVKAFSVQLGWISTFGEQMPIVGLNVISGGPAGMRFFTRLDIMEKVAHTLLEQCEQHRRATPPPLPPDDHATRH